MCDVRLRPEQLTRVAPLDPSSDCHHLCFADEEDGAERRLSKAIQVVKGRDSISVALTQKLSPEPTFLPTTGCCLVGGQMDETCTVSGWASSPSRALLMAAWASAPKSEGCLSCRTWMMASEMNCRDRSRGVLVTDRTSQGPDGNQPQPQLCFIAGPFTEYLLYIRHTSERPPWINSSNPHNS